MKNRITLYLTPDEDARIRAAAGDRSLNRYIIDAALAAATADQFNIPRGWKSRLYPHKYQLYISFADRRVELNHWHRAPVTITTRQPQQTLTLHSSHGWVELYIYDIPPDAAPADVRDAVLLELESSMFWEGEL